MTFVWRTGTTDPPLPPLSPHAALGPRIVISSVLGLGLIYFLLVLNTFRRYGDDMDKAWIARVTGWAREKLSDEKRHHRYPGELRRPRSHPLSYSPPVYDPMTGARLPENLTSTQYVVMPHDRFTPPPEPVMSDYPPPVNVQIYPPVQNTQYYPPGQSLQDYPSAQPIDSPLTPSVRSRSRSQSVSRLRRSEESGESLPSLPDPRPSNEIYWSNPVPGPIMAPSLGHSTIIMPASSGFFQTLKVMDLRFLSRDGNPMPDVLSRRHIQVKDWMQFISVCTLVPLLWTSSD